MFLPVKTPALEITVCVLPLLMKMRLLTFAMRILSPVLVVVARMIGNLSLKLVARIHASLKLIALKVGSFKLIARLIENLGST